MHRLWLIFTQAVTISVAVLFVIGTFRPEWLRGTLVAPVPTVTVVEAPASATLPSHAGAVQQALPAVVYISTRQEARVPNHPLVSDPLFRRFFGTPERTGLGSGVIVSPEGFILTNNHVIENADEIEVTLIDGRKFDVYLIGRDPETDLAVLKLVTGGASLPAIPFAPADSLAVGDIVLAIGNPFGFRQTVTMGIASALGRHHLGISTFENYIQTDAAINPGSSGGALIDGSGRLVGINTLIYSGTGQSLGIGFAIPVSIARKVLEQIITNGEVVRGWVGVEMSEVTPELAATLGMPANGGGVLISGVLEGSPADQGGVRPRDVLIAVDGRSVQNSRDMLDLVTALAPGQTATFRILRNGKETELEIAVGRRPPPTPAARH
ncbi:MAG: trypsin-like peptidase domain-containing protein [Azoarcus sp.]|jgi:serine protease DegS/serine protease DegQ|nr:trypsin-like peptidase domain-containing protein [Azoarcus sp.]